MQAIVNGRTHQLFPIQMSNTYKLAFKFHEMGTGIIQSILGKINVFYREKITSV